MPANLSELSEMPDYLRRMFAGLDVQEACTRPAPDVFAPVEQAWHLADLEREGFGERIRRLRSEHAPQLPDFAGDRIAMERQYLRLSLPEALSAFDAARRDNLAQLAAVAEIEWQRSGVQDGVGTVHLRDIPGLMLAHDRSHRGEIDAWHSTMTGQAQLRPA